MKVYVDEMPICCKVCPFMDRIWCDITGKELVIIKDKPKKCPLKLISDHDKQVRADERKKVCKKLRQKVENMYFAEDQDKGSIELAIIGSRNEAVDEFLETLDQIEKGENNGSVGD